MKTIKLPIYVSDDAKELIISVQKQQSSVIHWFYNRIVENSLIPETQQIKNQDFEKILKKHIDDKVFKNVNYMDSYFLRCSRLKAQAILESVLELNKTIEKDNKRKKEKDQRELVDPKKVIFGTKYNFYQRVKNKITKEEFKENRLYNIYIQGECNQNGNRKFELDLENNQIKFKLNRKNHITINLPKLRKPMYKQLKKLQDLSRQEINEEFLGVCFQIELSSKEIFISFDEVSLNSFKINKVTNRILGIDLNPNYIGYTITDFNNGKSVKQLVAKCYDLSKLNENLGLKSNNKKKIYQNNKRKYETIQIEKEIMKQAIHYRVEKIVLEDLSMPSEDKNKGSNFNRLVNNCWMRNCFTNKIKMDCKIYDWNVIEVNPMYTSFIGNLQYNYFDPVSSSIEIARRGLGKFISGNKLFPPIAVRDQWKEYLTDKTIGWKELYEKMRDIRYRVSLDEAKASKGFSGKSYIKSYTSLYNFI